MFVAVVMTADGVSKHTNGSLAAFCAIKKSDAIDKALPKMKTWQQQNEGREYWLAVGELTEKVTFPIHYTLERL